ncbi:MAG: DUF3365 domain-containing protein [Bdellovibrionales bacterium]|nr:DUF3365 domain-containing protein [Bdellovibrionales bacterium]
MRSILAILLAALLSLSSSARGGSAQTDPRLETATRAADAALQRLKSRLMDEMGGPGGAEKAIPFCHVSAIPMTAEEVSGKVVSVKRATLKPRNEANRATGVEAKLLKEWESLTKAGKPLPAFDTRVTDGQLHYFRPLKVDGQCLACHGQKESLAPGVKAELERNFPKDQATGYQPGDLRGLVHVIVK